MKILIVDDEVLERKAVAQIVKSSSVNVMVIGEAPNGRIAIEMAEEHRPDIIFMDIKMPGVNGVQAVKEIKKIDPNIRFIMVSAFNTFEYAKEVMQQGVKEYILKPSSKQDILTSLQRVADEVQAERRQKEEQESLRENLSRAVSIAQKEWVSSLLMNQMQDTSFDKWGQLLGVEVTSGYVMLFYLEQKAKTPFTAEEKQNWYNWLKDSLKNVVKKHEIMIGPITDTQVPILFLCRKTTEKDHFKTNAQATIEDLHRLWKTDGMYGSIKVGIGNPYHHAQELNKSYHEAVLALELLLKSADGLYLFCDQPKEVMERPSGEGFFEVEKKLLDFIRQGDVNQVMFILDSYISKQEKANNLNEATLKKSFDELGILISRMLHELGITYARTPMFGGSDDIPFILEKGKSYLLGVVQHVQIWRNNHAKGMLQKAKDYIEKHYAESITLESAAEYVELSPFYFSKLFKDRFGMTFIDYLTEIRIKHAKEEMLDPGKSLKEICYSIGYKDPNYFSRVFKKQTGQSPTEFRKITVSS